MVDLVIITLVHEIDGVRPSGPDEEFVLSLRGTVARPSRDFH